MVNQYRGIDVEKLEQIWLIAQELESKGIDIQKVTDFYGQGFRDGLEVSRKQIDKMLKERF